MPSDQDAPRAVTPTEQPTPAAAETKAASTPAKTPRKSVKEGTAKAGSAAKTPRKTTAKASTTKSAAKTTAKAQSNVAQEATEQEKSLSATTAAEKAAKPATQAKASTGKAGRKPKAAAGEGTLATEATGAAPKPAASAARKTSRAPAKKQTRTTQTAQTSPLPKATPEGHTMSPATEQSAPATNTAPSASFEISQPVQEAVPAVPAKEQQRQPRHGGGRGRGSNSAPAKQGSPNGAPTVSPAPQSSDVHTAPVVSAPSQPSATFEGAENAVAAEDGAQQNASAGRKQGRRGRGGKRSKNGTNGNQQSAAAMGVALAEGPFVFTDDEPAGPEMIIAEAQAPRTEASRAEEPAQNRTDESKGRSRSRRGRGRKSREDRLPGQDAAETAESWPTGEVDDFFAPADAGQESADDDSFDGEAPQQDAGNGRRKKGGNKKSQPAEAENQGKGSRRKMFVSVLPEEQVEVVLTEEGQVREYYVEMLHQAKTKGNIYKGIIHNIDPNLQAAFVSYGAVKNGFLQIDEVHPEYFNTPHDPSRNHKYPPIQKVLRPGQEVLVQVVKEPTGTKGAFLTTYLSLPGRFLVITPGREQIGVSRKVENETERARLRELLNGLNPGPGLGVIVRTVSMGADKNSLENDLEYLKETWNEIRTRGTSEDAPCLVYQEFDLATRAVRDYLTDDVVEVWLDDEPAANAVNALTAKLFPRKKNLVRVHQESMPLFERFNLQRQLDQIQSREVSLPSGGRLVIDATEALTAIDINSGRSSGKNNFEDMAYRTNMEAARMIPLQLRLRDIGGQVVADFIEMRDKSHWREVEKALRDGMKVDRARYDVGRISSFGMLEMVRQRLGSSAISVSSEPCPHCQGTGQRRNMEWQCQQALREITRQMRAAKGQDKLVYETDATLAMHLLNSKRQRLAEMELAHGMDLEIRLRNQ